MKSLAWRDTYRIFVFDSLRMAYLAAVWPAPIAAILSHTMTRIDEQPQRAPSKHGHQKPFEMLSRTIRIILYTMVCVILQQGAVFILCHLDRRDEEGIGGFSRG